MPEIKPDESKEDFIPRCIITVMEDGSAEDNKQAIAMCNSMWTESLKKNEKLKIETTEIKGKEIAYPGTFFASTGKVTITDKDIDELIKNFENGVIDAPALNLDHDDKFTKDVCKSLDVLRLGTVKRLYKDGKGLIADFFDVPLKVADLINSGLMNLRSIEFARKFKSMNDTVLNNVLTAVTFFGKDLPAIPGLRDLIPTLLHNKINDKSDDNEIVIVNILKQKENIMADNDDKVKLSPDEYKVLLKKGSDVEKLTLEKENLESTVKLKTEEIDKLKTTVTEKDTEIEKMKTEAVQVAKDKKQLEDDKDTNLKNECEKFIDNDVIKAQKLLPKFKDSEVERLFNLEKEGDADKVKLYKEEILSRGEVLKLDPKPSGDDKTKSVDDKVEHNELKTDEEMDKVHGDMEEKIANYMKAHKCEWNEAAVKLGVVGQLDITPAKLGEGRDA